MAAVAVSDVLEDERALARDGPLAAVLHSGFDGEHVHAVDLETGDVLPPRVVVRRGGRAVRRRTHAVLVV